MDDRFSYDDDFLVWTERQATALRALAKSRADLPNDLDLEHVAEEIEDLGISELKTVRSYIRNILIHVIKAACDPSSRAQAHWTNEIRVFHDDLIDRITPAMRSRVEMTDLWRRARKTALADLREAGCEVRREPPEACPFSLTEFIGEDVDIAALVAKLLEGA